MRRDYLCSDSYRPSSMAQSLIAICSKCDALDVFPVVQTSSHSLSSALPTSLIRYGRMGISPFNLFNLEAHAIVVVTPRSRSNPTGNRRGIAL